MHFLIARWTFSTTIDRFRDARVGRPFYAGELGIYTLLARFPACGARRVATFAGDRLDEASCENQAEHYSKCFHCGALKFRLRYTVNKGYWSAFALLTRVSGCCESVSNCLW